MSGRGIYLGLLLLVWGQAVQADQDSDLDLIPSATPAPVTAAPAAAASPDRRVYLENATTQVAATQDPAVPLPAPPGYTWQERLLLDIRQDYPIGQRSRLFLSDRFNLRDEDDLPFPSHEDIVTDFREAYISWRPSDQLYVDAGRINLKSGIALGYNPTDFFKTRSVTEPLSQDPSAQREDRLGTVMLRGQRIWGGGSLTFAYAPELHRPSAIYSNSNLPSFNPMFDRTNADDRWLIKGSVDFGGNSSPEFLLYREAGTTHFGTNLSMGLGQSAVAYLEWSGAERPDLITTAVDYGRETGTLPAGAAPPIPTATHDTFKSELALGLSYTTEADITFNVEYLLNQAGFSRTDWDDWFAAGVRAGPQSPLLDELWYLRRYAQDQQQQNTRQAYFTRADWVDAFDVKLELTAFALVDAYDHSGIAQLSADYYVSDTWTLGAQAVKYFGSRRSDFGSLGTSYSLLFSVAHYF
ncbi:MAG TPA: hypothetical protein VFK21_02850 [Gammaproteobacteria bacterium]|nr:hypothetical protein [Gammaproteobacteria bacterium]